MSFAAVGMPADGRNHFQVPSGVPSLRQRSLVEERWYARKYNVSATAVSQCGRESRDPKGHSCATVAHAGPDVLDHPGALGRTVTPPKLLTVGAVVSREVQGVAYDRQVFWRGTAARRRFPARVCAGRYP